MNIADLASTIREAMKHHFEKNPEARKEDVERAGFDAGIEFAKDKINREFICYLAHLEKSIYRKDKL